MNPTQKTFCIFRFKNKQKNFSIIYNLFSS